MSYNYGARERGDHLTPLQKRFSDLAVVVGTSAAAKEIWPHQKNPLPNANKMMDNPIVSSYISHSLDLHGANDDDLAKNIAEKVHCDDNNASLKATEMALKLKGHLKDHSTAVILTKDSFNELCKAYWDSKSEHVRLQTNELNEELVNPDDVV